MKKLLVVCTVMLLCLTGCTAQTPITPNCDFTAEISVGLGEDTDFLSGTLISSSQGTLCLEISTPDELSGLTYKWRENLNVRLQDISVEVEKGYFPDTSIPQVVYNVMFHLQKSGEFQDFDGNTATFTGDCESGEYIATTDSKGILQEISITELNICIKFKYKQ